MTFRKTLIAAMVASAAGGAHAVPALNGATALSAPAAVGTNETTQPFALANNYVQELVTDVAYMDGYFGPGGYPSTFRNFDMIGFGGASNQFIYIPHEVGTGGGVTRYNRDNGDAALLLIGNNSGVFESNPAVWNPLNDDFGGVDPAVTTPSGTLVVAEEWSGNGRMFELLNPTTATGTADANWRWLSNLPAVSHEGVKFDSGGNMYFIDENNSGSLYKFVPTAAGDYSAGQTFVLVDNDYAGNANENWNSAANLAQDRTGAATWVALTDAAGNALTLADPFDFSGDGDHRAGRFAADELNATPFGRPEDLELGVLGNGNEVLYLATTSEQVVYSFELNPNGLDVITREFLTSGTLDHFGNPIGVSCNAAVYGLCSPDNLALDADGNVYVIEDQGIGDIWQAIDADMDGIADVVGLLASLGPFGSEPTGFIMDPNDPNVFYVNIQHPNSGNDALWKISYVPTPPAALLLLAGVPLLRRKR